MTIFIDILGAANTWPRTQTFNGPTTDFGGTPRPSTDFGQSLGEPARRWDRVRGRAGYLAAMSGAAVATVAAGRGGLIAGTAGGPGTSELLMTGPYGAAGVMGNAYTQAIGQIARLGNDGAASTIMGGAFVGAGGSQAELITGPVAYGAFVGGYVFSRVGGGSGKIAAYASGFLHAYCAAYGAGSHLATITAGDRGTFCSGLLEGIGGHTLRCAGPGAFVQGQGEGTGAGIIEATAAAAFAQGNSKDGGVVRASAVAATAQGAATSVAGAASIVASAMGARATGFATGGAVGAATAIIAASANGALAHGVCTAGAVAASIAASGLGSAALGSALSGETIAATATNAFQLGVGTNATPSSLQVGGAAAQSFRALATGQHAGANLPLVLGAGAVTFATSSNVMTLTGDPGANTIATITGGINGQLLTLIFTDALITITDDNTHAANSVDLSAAFVSADDTVLQLVFDGVSWYEISRSIN